MNKGIIFLIVFISASMQAQNLDSLFSRFVEVRTPSKRIKAVVASSHAEKYKCAFGLASDVKLNFSKFTASQKNIIASLITRPVNDTSIVSPKGFFRIHYDLKGQNKPSYSVEELAAAADSAYAYEVGYLGYPAPPVDNGAGGDNKYDIYIENLEGYYGWTQPEDSTADKHLTSYMEIDNDFFGYYTTGIQAAKVTVAHEFHHAIQVGNYTYRSSDKYYNEITSTAMEEFVYEGINDYISYLPGFFDYPGTTISNHSGYDLAILNLYLKEKFGFAALKRIWEYINDNRALKAISLTLEENSAVFKNELSNFYTWTFYTGFRTISGKYFKNAGNFPLLKPSISVEYRSSEKMVITSTEPVSCSLLLFVNTTLAKPDSIYALVANADYRNGYEDPYKTTECDYYLSPDGTTGSRQIYSNYFVRFVSPVPDVLKDVNVVNNELINENTVISATEMADPFPQPFNYFRHSNVAIPAPKGDSDESLLYIYTLSMKLVYSGSLKVIKTDKLYVRWNGISDNNSRLPNGVYFYVTKRDDAMLKGKLVIQNE